MELSDVEMPPEHLPLAIPQIEHMPVTQLVGEDLTRAITAVAQRFTGDLGIGQPAVAPHIAPSVLEGPIQRVHARVGYEAAGKEHFHDQPAVALFGRLVETELASELRGVFGPAFDIGIDEAV